jgi:hypothetical protein
LNYDRQVAEYPYNNKAMAIPFLSEVAIFFYESHEIKKEGRGEEQRSKKKKAFAFFPIEIILSFSSLFFFVPQKSAALSVIFMAGLVANRPWWL